MELSRRAASESNSGLLGFANRWGNDLSKWTGKEVSLMETGLPGKD